MQRLFQSSHASTPEQSYSLQLFWVIEGLVALSFTIESLIEVVILPANAARWLMVIVIIDTAAVLWFFLARAGHIRPAGIFFVLTLWALVTGLAYTENGVRAPTVDIAYLVTILVAGLVLDERAGLITGVFCGLTLFGFALAGVQGLLPSSQIQRSPFATWEADVFYLAIVMGLQYLAIHRIRDALAEAHHELLLRRAAEANLRKSEEERAQSQMRVELHLLLEQQLEKERLKISRDLHDGPVQELIATTFALQGLIEDSPDEASRQNLLEIQQTLQEQVKSLRGFAGELRSSTLTRFGLGNAIREHLDRFHEKYPKIEAELTATTEGAAISQETRLALFRIYQEVMNNIVRHARATRVWVRLGADDHSIQLEIQDNGVGFEPPTDWMELARQGHLGLVGMRERAETIGGQFEVAMRKDQGTKVSIRVPLNQDCVDD